MNMKRVLFGIIALLLISNICCVWYYEHRGDPSVGVLQDIVKRQRFQIVNLKRDSMSGCHYKESLILQLKGLRNDNRSGDVCPACGNDSSIAKMTCWGCFPPENPYLDSCVRKLYRNQVKIYTLPDEIVFINNPSENAKRFLCSDCGYKWGSFKREKNM